MTNTKNQLIGALVPADISPNLNNLYDIVLPALGHSTVDALADVADNSLDANATKISIHLGNTKGKIDRIMIIDDGSGMDRFTLTESFRFSTAVPHMAFKI